jgi:hypothetical protein
MKTKGIFPKPWSILSTEEYRYNSFYSWGKFGPSGGEYFYDWAGKDLEDDGILRFYGQGVFKSCHVGYAETLNEVRKLVLKHYKENKDFIDEKIHSYKI